MRFQFQAAEDPDTGELGWKDSRIAFFSPYGPLAYHYGLAHDVLEHFKLETVSDEIMAHAAMYWGRYSSGYVNEYGRGITLSDIGAEWGNLARAMGEHHLTNPPRTCKLDETIEEDISAIIEDGRKTVREELGEDSDRQDIADEIAKAFRGWFRIGYRKTAKRWARWNMSPGDVSFLYTEVARAFEHNEPETEGQEVSLIINKNGKITMHSDYSEVY